MDLSTSLDRITIPALHVSGWYDTYLNGTVAGFRALSANSPDNQYLLAGPWVHIPWSNRIGTQNFGAEALLDTDNLLLRWFNHWLKDSGEFAAEPKIRHFALNQNRWHSAASWPAESALTLFLHSEGRANSSKGNGTLTPAVATATEPADILSVDPEVPVIAPGGIASASGCFNQAAAQQGNNVLIYTSEPFESPLHIFGTPSVTLHASTSAAHADLVAKLTCVRPNGDSDFVCIGIARSTHLFTEYTPDTPQLWRFDLEPTSWVFAPGERLRLEISGNAYPLYDRNPHTAVKPAQADSWSWKRSTHILHHTTDFPSTLHLPLVP
jgi:putative CocE/NonD family hydrolase